MHLSALLLAVVTWAWLGRRMRLAQAARATARSSGLIVTTPPALQEGLQRCEEQLVQPHRFRLWPQLRQAGA